jgi:hypothetical protein
MSNLLGSKSRPRGQCLSPFSIFGSSGITLLRLDPCQLISKNLDVTGFNHSPPSPIHQACRPPVSPP